MDFLVDAIIKDMEIIRERELQKAYKNLANTIGSEEKLLIKEFSVMLMNSLLSTPLGNITKEIENNTENKHTIVRLGEQVTFTNLPF